MGYYFDFENQGLVLAPLAFKFDRQIWPPKCIDTHQYKHISCPLYISAIFAPRPPKNSRFLYRVRV